GNAVRDTVVDAPKLDLPRSDSPVANLLAFKTIPGAAPAEGLSSSQRAPQLVALAVAPSPDVQRDDMRSMPALNASAVAPTPDIQRDRMQAAPAFSAAVVPPTPSNLQRDIDSMRAPGSRQLEVVPPPISAPERNSNLNARLSLPAASVVAPPPSWIHEVAARGPGLGPGELQNQIVPPPVQVAGSSREHHGLGGIGTSEVVAPPVEFGGALHRPSGSGMGGVGSAAVVPPPPSTSAASGTMGSGRGDRGVGLGGPFDIGSVAAPPTSGGSGGGSGVVVSRQPGSKVGVPGGGAGVLAMSPAGGARPGAGGSGGGTGIGRGNGPGSGFDGEGPGAGKTGSGRGSDPAARGGASPYPGSGGAGSGTNGTPPLSGVAVKGGNNIVTLPSFDSKGSQPRVLGKSSMPADQGPGITVVATSRSGGAFNFYGALKGDKVYTIYIETALGTAVMQIADPASADHPSADDLEMP